MDTIRLILPQLLTYAFLVAIIFIVAFFITKELKITNDNDGIKLVKKIKFYVLIFISICVGIWIITLLSVNNVPRSTIDRSGMDDQKNAFKSYTDSVNASSNKKDIHN